MRRYLFEMKSDKDSGITSVFCRDSLKRYIYIEAKRRANVRKALENINYVFSTKLRLVPPQEMADCLKMKSKSVELIPGSWVRPKKGLYAGDIAKVTEVLVNGDVLCTLIPRINFEKLSTTGRFASSDQSSVKKAQDNTRPPQKLFNPAEYKYGYRRDNGYYIIGNNWINKRGFLEKAFKPSSINSTNVQPVLSEISNFSSASGDRIDLSNIGPNSTTSADDFQIGDVVIATAGSIKGTFGIVSSIQNGIVSFIPDESFKLNNTTVNLTFKELRRHLKVGDHVNIVGGEDAGETGIIVEVLDGTVTILSDSTLSEIKAFNRDVRLAVRTVTYQKMDAPYSSGDPVSFVGGAGVALKVDKSNVVVLNHFGQIQTLQMQKLRPKRGIHKATATDAFGRVITQDSSVEVVSKSAKDHSKIRATVIHIYKNSVFVKSREISENNGIIVVRSNKLYLLEQGIKDENRPLNRSYSHKRQYFNTQGYTQSAAYTSRNNRRMNGRRNRGDEYMSQTVVITSGPYKGYVGTVKDTCDETARVELHSKDHIVAISKSKLKLKEELETPLQRGHDGFVSTGSGTVMHHYRRRGGDIPYSDDIPCVDYGKDPAYHHPAQTPSYYNSRTPAWNPNISLPRNPD